MQPQERVWKVLEELSGEIDIFQLLSPDETGEIAPYLSVTDFPAGSILAREGDRLDYLGIVAAGRLEAKHRPTVGEKPITIARLERGSHVGTVSAGGGRPAMASIVAEVDTTMLVLTAEKFDAFAERHPASAVRLLKGVIEVLSVRLDSAIDRVVLFF